MVAKKAQASEDAVDENRVQSSLVDFLLPDQAYIPGLKQETYDQLTIAACYSLSKRQESECTLKLTIAASYSLSKRQAS